MAELKFNNVFFISTVLIFQLEIFFLLCYKNYIFFNKTIKAVKVLENQSNLISNSPNVVFFIIFIIFSLYFKGNFFFNPVLFVAFTLFGFFLDKILNFFNLTTKLSTNASTIIIPLIFGLLCLLFFVKSLLSFFFFIELCSVFYYFFFLTSYSLSNQTFLKYKNGLLLLLWNNFLTTIFLSLSCYFFIVKFGTTDFNELSLLTISCNYSYIFFIGLAWKLGLPLFHFFKLEIYKYLLRENVFLFSIITTLINVTLLYFILSQSIIFNTIYLNNLFIIPIIFSVCIVIVNLKLTSILYYLAVSSILTMTTIFTIFLL